MARQSITRLTTKSIARTTVNRAIVDNVGNGLLGSIMKVLASQAIKEADKYKVSKDKDFDISFIEKRNSTQSQS